MHVALVISSLTAGGAERVMSLMANYWAQTHWRVTLITLDGGDSHPFYPLHPAIDYRPLGLLATTSSTSEAIAKNLHRVFGLRDAIYAAQPNVVISFMNTTNVLVLLATRGLGVPVIVSERSVPTRQRLGRAWTWLRQRVYPMADQLVVQSQAVKDYFPTTIRRKARIIPNPVLVPPVHPSPQLTPKSIVALGRFCEEKGFDLLIRAFAHVSTVHPDWSLTIFGDGPLRLDLEKLRDDLGLNGVVHLPGRTQDSYGTLQRAEIFVLPSRYEGFPNALCEAMACGNAVIATDCPEGPRTIIQHEKDGLLVPADSPSALSAAMCRLIEDPAERRQLGQAASAITERLGIDKVMHTWENVIKEITRQ